MVPEEFRPNLDKKNATSSNTLSLATTKRKDVNRFEEDNQ
jgi:hypothetical protein